MALLKPNTEDIRKLHAEVNQIVNQRVTATTAAVTILGVVLAWMIPKTPPTPCSDVGGFVFFGSILLLLLLFILFWFSYTLRGMLRIITSYLLVTKSSNWEIDWKSYRDERSEVIYTKSQTIIFLLLGVVSASFPFVLALVFSQNLAPKIGVYLHVSCGLLYFAFVVGIGLFDWWNKETQITATWNKLDDQTGDKNGGA
jgi:hypothetical protein